jgi:6-pyruvoyltetrahydropterin/6-carboxytetrahydropterin synthase
MAPSVSSSVAHRVEEETLMWTLHVEEEFSSAHANGPDGHKCNEMHGHDWLAIVEITYKKVDENGWGPDFGAIKTLIKPLDHRNLNEYFNADFAHLGEGMKPSAENIARWLYKQVTNVVGYTPDFVTICEGGENRVTYRE